MVLKTNLEGVLESLIEFAKSNIWLEITTLLIPGVNDSSEEIEEMAAFISTKLGREVPWHFSAFHPDYKMQETPNTPYATLLNAKEIAHKHGIKYVYLGNVANDNNTYCPNCKELLIERTGFSAHVLNLEDDRCIKCGYTIKGVWE